MKPKILIVDDDLATRQQLFWMLCDEYEVITANDMASGIRRATIYEPAVSIVDLHLPPLPDSPEGGLRVLGHIKERQATAKVLMVSSADSTEMQEACLANGADEFLSKPLDIQRLLMSVRRCALAPQACAA